MPNSVIFHNGNGSSTQFALNFNLDYFTVDDLTVYVDGEVDGFGDPIPRTFSLITANLIDLDGSPPPVGTNNVQILRTVDNNVLKNTYTDGPSVTGENLNASFLQVIYLVHEIIDGRFPSPFAQDLDFDGLYTVTNLRDPVALQEPVTVAYFNEALTTAASIPNPPALGSFLRASGAGASDYDWAATNEPLTVAYGGTGAVTAAAARTNLGVLDVGFARGHEDVTNSNLTVEVADAGTLFKFDLGSSNRSAALPTAAAAGDGFRVGFLVVSQDASETLTINPNGSETVDDFSIFVLTTVGDYVWLESDGTQWHSVAAALKPVVTYIDTAATSTHTPTPGRRRIHGKGCAGGGGGAGANTTGGSSGSAGSAGTGGAGAWFDLVVGVDLDPGTNLTYSIGSGGAGGSAGAAGSNGGSTILAVSGPTTILDLGGGTGGSADPADTVYSIVNATAGGVVATGLRGQNGGPNGFMARDAGTLYALSVSGGSIFGPGGASLLGAAGEDAANPGAGGGASANSTSSGARDGGDGGDGALLIIEEYR